MAEPYVEVRALFHCLSQVRLFLSVHAKHQMTTACLLNLLQTRGKQTIPGRRETFLYSAENLDQRDELCKAVLWVQTFLYYEVKYLAGLSLNSKAKANSGCNDWSIL